MNHSKLAIVITITCIVLTLAIIGGTWGPASAQTTTTVVTVNKGGGKGPKGDNAGCPVESGCINGLPKTGAAPLQTELPWALVIIPLIIACLGAFTYGFSMRGHRQAKQVRS
jgi:hypothetical protein